MSSTPELAWFKSTYSSGSSGDCVEIAPCPTAIHVRDSKDTDGPHLRIPATAWAAFVTYAAAQGHARGR
ncbi:hypothetical protein SSP35_12_01060 [Streptomyces sp. NBRC 110611]|uniref:DUF397 domain-containing protein n=1 Tax=Streptomyces sp. NBRC 110611 TaxID=1621259 RepID=UPI0008378D1F|nr:DUF397 domain-containing protein [Streptomyces sp. NBRC 110611]GAU69458.1 hypothetical protein SSP35_12_01060 [Streptomyces sp. NBRC 110611]